MAKDGSDSDSSNLSDIFSQIKITAQKIRAKLAKLFRSVKLVFTRKRVIRTSTTIVVILIAIVASIYGYYIHRYNKEVRMEQGYADSWEELTGDTTPERDLSAGEPSAPNPTAKTGSDNQEQQDFTRGLTYYEGINESIIRRRPIDKNVENILLIGVDAGKMEQGDHNSDTMIVVSFHKKDKTARAVSLMRDIWVYYPNRGGYDKLNASFSYGGPGQTVNIINENFNLDIQKYIVTDFEGLRNLVDILGGIELKVTNAESRHIEGVSGSNTYNLNGDQALDYARIRAIDSDFSRVQRQRNVIMAMLENFNDLSANKQLKAVDNSLKYIRSNISANQMTGDLLDLVTASSSEIKQMTVPEWGYYTVHEDSIWYMSLDWEGQNNSLHRFLYDR